MNYINVSFVEYIETDKVQYYTIQLDAANETEVESFLNRFETNPYYLDQAEEIIIILDEIGKRGAYQRYFRKENISSALPPKEKIKFAEFGSDAENSLRLYCLRVSESIVILFNGGIKESEKIQDSPDLMEKFQIAESVSMQFLDRVKKGLIRLMSKELIIDKRVSIKIKK